MDDIFFAIFQLAIFLGLIGAIVYGFSALSRRRRGIAESDPGIGTVRRLYFYGVSFVALMMAVNGIVQIGVFVLDALFGGDVIDPSRVRLAVGLSLTVIGLPLWAAHWRIITRHVRELPVETRSVVRKSYVYLVLGVAVGVAISAALGVLHSLFSTEASSSGYPWVALVVWAGVWLYHWQLETAEGQPTTETRTVRRLYVYLLSAATLVMLSVGVGQVIYILLREAYDSLTSVAVLTGAGLWRDSTRDALGLAVVGGPVWAVHWLRFARPDSEPTLRHLYLFALVLLGSVGTMLVALGLIINGALVWAVGVPDEASAAAHFRFLPETLASLIVGGGILAYHRWAIAPELNRPTTEYARGSYRYALAAVGLVTLASAISTLVHSALTVLAADTGPTISGEDLWRNGIALGITFGMLGGPLWGYYWTGIQRRISGGDAKDQASLTRRIFIFAALGVGMLALVGSASFLMFVFFRELLDGDLSQVVPDSRVSIAIIVSTAIFVPYYWMVYRADRRAAPEKEDATRRERKAVTVLVSPGGAVFVSELEAALGYGVSPVEWADPEASQPELSDLDELAERISAASGANVLLVPDGTSVRVLSYR